MADIPGEQAHQTASLWQVIGVPRLIRWLPGVTAALLFLALATGDLFLGRWATGVEVGLALLLLVAITVQPRVVAALRRAAAWPTLRHSAALGGVIGLALFLRVWGVNFGLPYFEHPDEWAVADRALVMLRSADYSPHSFIYPTLYTYLQLGVAAIHFLWGASAGVYRTVEEIDPARFYLWGRTLTALLGTGAVLCTYAIGRLLYGRTVGLLAAALLAIYPAAVGDAHYITTDTPAMFFTALAFLAIAWLGTRPPARRQDRLALTLIGGLGAGLATATKYNVAVLVAPLLLAIVFTSTRDKRQEERNRRQEITDNGQRTTDNGQRFGFVACFTFYSLLAGLGVLLGFTLGTPMWLRELPQMLNDIASVIAHYKFIGHPGAESAHPARFYWDLFTTQSRLLAWVFLGGVMLAFVRHNRSDLLILSFLVPSFLQLIGVKVVFFRNVMPLLPFLCTLAAILVVAFIDWLEAIPQTTDGPRRTTGLSSFFFRLSSFTHTREVFLTIALIALAIPPLASSIREDWLRAEPTTRLLATTWVEQHAPDGARLWLEDQTLILPARFRIQGGQPATIHDIAWYRASGFRFVVVDETSPRDDQAQLAQFGPPAARFETNGQRHGPTLAIYDTGFGDPSRDPRTPSGATLGGGAVVLDGYQHPPETRLGAVLPLALYWRAVHPVPTDYTVYVHLLDANGATVAQRDLAPLEGNLPTTRWKPGDLIRDDQDLPIPDKLPAGTYKLVVGMYDAKTLTAINDNGPIAIGEVAVR